MALKNIRQPKYEEGQVITQEHGLGNRWNRKVTRVIYNYLQETGKFGYEYEDDFSKYNMCSEAVLTRWGNKYKH